MASNTDVAAAITTLRDTMVGMDQRMQALQAEMALVDQRLTTHEGIHDPYLQVIDGLRAQSAGQAGNAVRIQAVEDRITALTTQMSDSGLDERTASRVAAVESQLAAITGHQAHMAMQAGQARAQTVESIRAMGDSLAVLQNTMTKDYPTLFLGLQDRCTKVENEIVHMNSKLDNVISNMPTMQQWSELQNRINDFDLGTPVADKVTELENKITKIASKMGEERLRSMGGQTFSIEKCEAVKQLPVFDNGTKVSFERWASVIRTQVSKKEEWKGILQWAQDKGKEPLDHDDLEPDQDELGQELWALLDYKLEGEPWRYRRTMKEGHGLELWRRLHEEYDPRDNSEATVLKIQLNNLAKIKKASEVKTKIESLEFGIQKYNAMADEPMSQGEQHSMLSRITPLEFMKSQLLAGNDVSKYKSLRERLLLWAKGDKEHRKITTSSSTAGPMEVGHVGGSEDDVVSRVLKGMQDMHAQTQALLAAMVKGGGGGGGQRQPRQPQQDGGKGGPKGGPPSGGKGPMATLPDGRRIPVTKLRICRDFCKPEGCSRGKACSFPHVSGLPKALQEKAVSAQGLLLGSLGISTRAEEGVWKFDPAKEKEVLANLNSSPASAKPHGEVGGLGEQEEDEWNIEGMDRATLETILEGSGFGGPGHH